MKKTTKTNSEISSVTQHKHRRKNKHIQLTKYVTYGGATCNIIKIINNIYNTNIIFPSSNSCFTNGTFIFEDNDSKFFNSIISQCSVSRMWYKSTHNIIKKQENFDCTFDINHKCNNNKIVQYEINLVYKGNPFYIHCRNNGKEDRVDKRVVLIYNFSIKVNGIVMKYTFFKLEAYPTISIGHTKDAITRYVLRKEPVAVYSPKRREDCILDKNKCTIKPKIDEYYNNNNSLHQDLMLYLNKHTKNDKVKKEILKSFDFFDKNVRTGDEYFVPQFYTNYLHNIINPSRVSPSHVKPTSPL